jgi:hypothetical protein
MLVLAMEFSRGARCRPMVQAAGRSARAVDEHERRRLRGSSDKKRVAPSKRNSDVRRSHTPGYGAGPGRSLEGNGSDATAAEHA